MGEFPAARKIDLFCITGSPPAQATFALRVTGMENAVVRQAGLIGLAQYAGY